jgi:RNA polymerase sigma-70 factor (ECF subfamily)
LQAHDPESWRQLTKLYGPLVYYWCRRFGLNPTDAADVFQETFSAVSISVDRFQKDQARGRFRGWLWTITRNKIHDHFRSQAGREGAVGGTEAQRGLAELPEQLAESPIDAEDRGQLGSLFQRALETVRAEFESRTWDAFWRVVVGQHTPRAVAADLGISTNAVHQAKSRVLRRLRAVLGDVIE